MSHLFKGEEMINFVLGRLFSKLSTILIAAVYLWVSPLAQAADEPGDGLATFYEDGSFDPGIWQREVVFTFDDGAGSSSSWQRNSGGGNPGAYARCTNTVVIDGDNGGGIWTALVCQEAKWDPATDGPLDNVVSYIDNRRSVNQGFRQVIRFVAKQGDVIWMWGAGTSQSFDWNRFERAFELSKPAGGYRNGEPTTDVPDLTTTGAPIYFGFAYGNSNPAGLDGYVASNDYDNFRVCIPATDTDGDGLLDDWERNGVPYTSLAGKQERYIIDVNGDGVSDADPMKADIFVEVDVMENVGFSELSKQLLVNRFAEAPIQNPDNSMGVRLHLVLEPSRVPGVTGPLYVSSVGYDESSAMPVGFTDWREHFFGMKAERDHFGDAEWPVVAEARARVFRYALVMSEVVVDSVQFGERTLFGKSEAIPSNSLVVCAESIEDKLSFENSYFGFPFEWTLDEFVATVFMHELGHSLGLGHGGFDDRGSADNINGKPNYFSIMNYFAAVRDNRTRGWWRMDFARGEVAAIDESRINELDPLPRPAWIDDGVEVRVPIGVSNCNALCDVLPWEFSRKTLAITVGQRTDIGDVLAARDTPCDWCPDGAGRYDIVAQDLNFYPANSASGQSPELTVLTAYNDWDKRWLKFAPVSGQQIANASFLDPFQEPSVEGMRRSGDFPLEYVCYADLVSPFDGRVDDADLMAFVEAFLGQNMTKADWNRDDVLDLKDIVGYLREFQRPECQK